MSIICWDGKRLAADRQVSDGSMIRSTTKIREIKSGKFKGYLIGAAGATATANLLMDWFEAGANPKHFPYEYAKSAELGASLLVITTDKEVHRYDHLPVPIVMENREYAIGSGREFAHGAMEMGADAIKACEIACSLSTDCGVAIDVIEWREPNGRKGTKGKASAPASKTRRTGKATATSKRTARQSGNGHKKNSSTIRLREVEVNERY